MRVRERGGSLEPMRLERGGDRTEKGSRFLMTGGSAVVCSVANM